MAYVGKSDPPTNLVIAAPQAEFNGLGMLSR